MRCPQCLHQMLLPPCFCGREGMSWRRRLSLVESNFIMKTLLLLFGFWHQEKRKTVSFEQSNSEGPRTSQIVAILPQHLPTVRSLTLSLPCDQVTAPCHQWSGWCPSQLKTFYTHCIWQIYHKLASLSLSNREWALNAHEVRYWSSVLMLWWFSILRLKPSLSADYAFIQAACVMADWQQAVASLVLRVPPPCSILLQYSPVSTNSSCLLRQWDESSRHSWGSNNDNSEH